MIFVTESCSFEGRDQSQRRPYQGEAGTYEKAINSSCLTYGVVKQLKHKFNIPTMILVTINIGLPDVRIHSGSLVFSSYDEHVSSE